MALTRHPSLITRQRHSMDPRAEWLEPNGLGGFASGTVSGLRTSRYHALLLTATTPPTGRMVLVNGFDAWVEASGTRYMFSSQYYAPGVTHPDAAHQISAFDTSPWPRWRFELPDGIRIEQEILGKHGAPVVAVSWRLATPREHVRLCVRPFFSGRDFHALHHENPAFRFEPTRPEGIGRLLWRPYPDVPGILIVTNGTFTSQPEWYRNFLYVKEQSRGLDHTEDLAAPGVFDWDLTRGEAVWILAAQAKGAPVIAPALSPSKCLTGIRSRERRRRTLFPSRLHRSADAYLVRRGKGRTIIAGYPWFADWGRDTFISLRGICLATGRLDDARAIPLEWTAAASDGMLPNRFPDERATPEFNSVDASLWYVVAVHEFFEALAGAGQPAAARDAARMRKAIEAILSGYTKGTRYGIKMAEDGLLAAGVPGVQLTWM